MMSAREAIYNGLYTKLIAATGVKTSSRNLKHWTEVDWSSQPALFQAQLHETPINGDKLMATGLPTAWSLELKIYVYTNVGGDLSDAAFSSTQMNSIVDAIESVMQPPRQGERNTLGGLVYDARIIGQIETDEGTLGTQSVSIIPLRIIA